MSAPARDLRVWVQGIGLLGPGLSSWQAAIDMLRGTQARVPARTVLPSPMRLPPAERRRAGSAVKLAMAVADQAVLQAQADPSTLATVFTSSSGECDNCHALCETLATAEPMVSPTRFTNSVHNAASGAWHIAVASRASSTSLCAFDGSFGAGLIDAVVSARASGQPVMLVASDSPYPEPLNATRPLPDHFGLALLLSPVVTEQSLASLALQLSGTESKASWDAAFEDLRAIPAAAALPLLAAIAKGHVQRGVAIDYLPTLGLRVDVEPVGAR